MYKHRIDLHAGDKTSPYIMIITQGIQHQIPRSTPFCELQSILLSDETVGKCLPVLQVIAILFYSNLPMKSLPLHV